MAANVGWVYLFAGLPDLATAQARKTLEMDPTSLHANYVLGSASLAKSRFEDALAVFEKAASLSGDALSLAYLAHACGRSGQTLRAQALVRELVEESTRKYVTPVLLVYAYVGLGDRENAFEWVEKACQERASLILWIKVHPIFAPLRDDPRFPDLVRRIGLPP